MPLPQPQPAALARVFLIGAGPGDPGLITLRGRDRLRLADVVLYDYLCGEGALAETRPGAELICLGRHGAGKLWSQPEIIARMLAEARAGRVVARLKGGDPSVFGRVAEEIDALVAAGVPFEVVPGVTTASAAAAYAAIPLTDRDHASCVALVTGQVQAGSELTEAIDFAPLARFPGTLVLYMGVTSAGAWSRELMAHGKPPETPVALVRRCTHPDQETLETTLGGVAEVILDRRLRPPIVAIVGAVALRGAAGWFESRPLFGQTVLVTRPERQADALAERLADLGARVIRQPAIEIEPPDDWAEVDRAINRLATYDWVVFSSANGVESLMSRLESRGLDARRFGAAKLASIGPATTRALRDRGLIADAQPDTYRAESLAGEIAGGAEGKRILLIRASRGRETLAEMLCGAGGQVDQVVAYQSNDVVEANPEVLGALLDGQVDWITVTSSAIARSLAAMLGERLRQAKLVAISPLTAEALTQLGYPPKAVASEYTADGVVAAVLAATTQA
ncbi:Uroporphyrinogen-III C-methyltransferase [Pirellulimonas nuda]|uniref:uroporphyrinogen-III C-methyltransferase n=1 Tax=Pirellulimonas nuda TaxID=2528009 RepID=A0A518D801_9BACT|nr:uroporphyrinogen-III C-methyltransferase [Pirellulimonas nuda]QDU87609.1 Uroporphyrinogen-III C-methyltransferase [Pirellulimonas nuda]